MINQLNLTEYLVTELLLTCSMKCVIHDFCYLVLEKKIWRFPFFTL